MTGLVGIDQHDGSLVHQLCESHRDHVDVVILGGGPAGTSTAIALARAGWSVIVIERSHYDSPRIGETLPPEVNPVLKSLGLWNQFLLDEHIQSPGVATAWGQAELYHNDFIANPHGPGWHVERCRFDTMLARAAQASGAVVLTNSTPIACTWDPETGWHLAVVANDMVTRWRATMLVDATGRSASRARFFCGRRMMYDRLIGLVGLMPVISESIIDHRTLVEAIEEGWWYTALLPRGQQIAAFMTDGDLMPSGHGARDKFWWQQLQRAPYTRARLEAAAQGIKPCVVSATSSCLEHVVGPGRLGVGDAAMTVDPLSSQGITWALESGLAGAKAVDAHLRGGRTALDSYARRMKSVFLDYLDTRAEYYRREWRWPDRPFWRRRHTAH